MSTSVEVNGKVVAVRFSRGRGNGCVVEMQVNRDEWEAVKFEQAQRDDQGPGVGSAESHVNAMCDEVNVERTWKTASQFMREARQFDEHRFAMQMPEFFGAAAAECRARAAQACREQMRVV